jgi:hypothetical protein
MSNTRHAKDGQPHDQGFCSSAEYERGLLGNLVAMRCETLPSGDQAIVQALQLFSWQSGGLDRVASELLDGFSDRFCTPSMAKLGVKGIYNAGQIRKIRSEFKCEALPAVFSEPPALLLQGEQTDTEIFMLPQVPDERFDPYGRGRDRAERAHEYAKLEASLRPTSYPAPGVNDLFQKAARAELPGFLRRLCIDPSIEFRQIAPWWCPDLICCLKDYIVSRSKPAALLVETEISRQVFGALDYCLETGEMPFVQGLAGLGKSFAAKTWCEMHPGQARYVQVPSNNDDASFVRRVAEAYGVSSGLSMKLTQIRERVERTARSSSLVLCLDEGHYLLPQDYRARKRPSRITWIMNEFVNYGVRVAIFATPQFEADKAVIQKRTGWNWDQFDRRIGAPIILPQELPEKELEAVAKAHFAEGSDESIEALVGYAMFSKSQIAGIEHIVKRARFEAAQAGKAKAAFADIKRAIERRMAIDGQPSLATRPSRRRMTGGFAQPAKPERPDSRREIAPPALITEAERSTTPALC